MSTFHVILAGSSLFLLLGAFLPTSESAPQGSSLQEDLPKEDCVFLAALTGATCPPETTTPANRQFGGSCTCVPLGRCLDPRPTSGGAHATEDGAPVLVGDGAVGGIAIRTGPDQGKPTDRSNVLIDIGDRTITTCGDILSVCCENVKNEEPQPQPPPPLNPPVAQCGIRNTNGVGVTITGFQEGQAQLSEFPWMVAVLGTDNTYLGGASLVNARVVLTAAHKVHGQDGQMVARIGDWDLSATSEPIPSQNINVQKVLYHPEFNSKTLVNDVALLILESEATLGDTVMPICLPDVDQVFDGATCFVTGWGKDVFGKTGKYQKIMKKVSVPAVSHGQCQNMLRNTRLGPTFNLHNTFNCAGGQGEDACEGDGGSPLVCPNPNNNNQYIQMGVVAWGIGCGQVGNPGVYGSIPKTAQWIRDTMQIEIGFDIRTTSVQKDSRGK